MDLGLTVVIVLVVLAVVALIALLAIRGRQRRKEQQRIEAAEHRQEAEIRSASAQRREAEAAERSARAEREQAHAREQAARARQDREVAESRQAAADRLDLDGGPGRPDDRSRDEQGAGDDPAARTDELQFGERRPEDARPAQGERIGQGGDGRHQGAPGRHEARQADQQAHTDPGRQQAGGGWHGPTATGGFPAAEPGRDAGPGQAGPQPSGSLQTGASDQGTTGASDQGTTAREDASGQVPSQRSGEHDRGPVRSLADRLLRRNG